MLWLIRILRKMPHSRSFDDHLDRCAFAHILLDEQLTVGKIIGRTPIEAEYMTYTGEPELNTLH